MSTTKTRATWEPPETQAHSGEKGRLTAAQEEKLPDSAYAFPDQRKEPMTDASHVRNAIARFDQVKDVSDEDREVAWANIKKAARHWEIDYKEEDWHDLGKKPHTKNPSQ